MAGILEALDDRAYWGFQLVQYAELRPKVPSFPCDLLYIEIASSITFSFSKITKTNEFNNERSAIYLS